MIVSRPDCGDVGILRSKLHRRVSILNERPIDLMMKVRAEVKSG